MKKTISLIIPCYNEEESIGILYDELDRVSKLMKDYSFEMLFVNDGSKDDTLGKMRELAKKDDRVIYLSFSRNFGKESAMYAGLSSAKGEYIAVMDADMQDPPELLPEMVSYLETGEYDSVATRRVSRKGEPIIRSFFARQFYRIMNRISDADVADGARDFRIMNREMADAVISLCERNRFSKGIFGWVGFKTKWLPYENRQRVAGETKWNFWGLFKYSLDGFVNFSQAPLSIASYIGLFFTFVAFLAIIFIMVRKFVWGDSVSGWPSLVCIITFIGGVQLFCLGIIGQYISKMYLEIKARPHYIIKETNDEEIKKVN